MEEDIKMLEGKINKDYKDMMSVINSTSLPLFVEDTIEDMHILIENLIARNKELDKENQALFEAYNFNDTNLLAKILKEYRMEILNSISKSKVKEILEPTPINPIPIEIQTSSMYIKLQELLNKGE